MSFLPRPLLAVLAAVVLASAIVFDASVRVAFSTNPPSGAIVAGSSYGPDGREVAFWTDWRERPEIWTVSTVDGGLRPIADDRLRLRRERDSVIFSIGGAFFAFVLGGWAAARVAGIRRSEPAMLHGAIAFLVTVPIMLVLASLGATVHYGGWYTGLGGTPAWVSSAVAAATDPNAAAATRNAAFQPVVQVHGLCSPL